MHSAWGTMRHDEFSHSCTVSSSNCLQTLKLIFSVNYPKKTKQVFCFFSFFIFFITHLRYRYREKIYTDTIFFSPSAIFRYNEILYFERQRVLLKICLNKILLLAGFDEDLMNVRMGRNFYAKRHRADRDDFFSNFVRKDEKKWRIETGKILLIRKKIPR